MRGLRSRRTMALAAVMVVAITAATFAAVNALGTSKVTWPKPPIGASWQDYFGLQSVPDINSSGPKVFDPKPGHLYFYTNAGTGWGATNTKNSVVIFDATDMVHWTVAAVSNLPDQYSVGYSSHSLGVSADGSEIYLPSMGGGPGRPPVLLALDGFTLKPDRIYKETLGGIGGHHVNNFTGPDGRQYMMGFDFNWNYGGAGAFVIDPTRNSEIVGGMGRLDFEGNAYILSDDVQGKYMYATAPAALASLRGKMDGALDKIDMTTWKVVGAVPVKDPIWVEPTQDGKIAWVTQGDAGKVAKVDLATMQVIDEVTTGPGPYGARLSCDESQLFVADKGEASGYNQMGRTITVIDTRYDVVTDVLPTGRTTDHLILSPDCKYLVASSNADHDLWIYNVETHAKVRIVKIPNGGDPHAGTFVQFKSDGKGGVAGEVVSALVGLRGSARVAQQALIKATQSATEIRVIPKSFFAGTPASLSPDTVSVQPGASVALSFTYPAGTSSPVAQIQASGAVVQPFTLQPGQRHLVTFKAPSTPGQILFTLAGAAKPLTVSVSTSAGTGSTTPVPSKYHDVSIQAKSNQFDLKTLTVKAGEQVRFTLANGDDEPHNLINPEIGLTRGSSPDASGGKTLSFVWRVPNTPGTYKIICTYHPWMVITTTIQK